MIACIGREYQRKTFRVHRSRCLFSHLNSPLLDHSHEDAIVTVIVRDQNVFSIQVISDQIHDHMMPVMIVHAVVIDLATTPINVDQDRCRNVDRWH
jgi:hypothetical protein